MHLFYSSLAIASLILCGTSAALLAQERVVTPGRTVRLQLSDEWFVGRVVSIERDTVHLKHRLDSPITRFALDDIRAVDLRIPGHGRRQRTLIGALIGAGVGAAGGLYLSTHVPCVDCVITRQDQVLGTLFFAGVFSMIGGITGFATTRGEWVSARFSH